MFPGNESPSSPSLISKLNQKSWVADAADLYFFDLLKNDPEKYGIDPARVKNLGKYELEVFQVGKAYKYGRKIYIPRSDLCGRGWTTRACTGTNLHHSIGKLADM